MACALSRFSWDCLTVLVYVKKGNSEQKKSFGNPLKECRRTATETDIPFNIYIYKNGYVSSIFH